VMDIAPRDTVQGSIMAGNVVVAFTAMAPFGVARLLENYQLERILWGAIGIAIVALLASGLLVESHLRVRSAPGAWRPRRQTPRTV